METKHTPGPWRATGLYGEETADVFLIWSDTLQAAIGSVFARTESDANAQAANARLIAAAPDLLVVLKKAVEILESEPDAYGIYKAHLAVFKDTIDKVTGAAGEGPPE